LPLPKNTIQRISKTLPIQCPEANTSFSTALTIENYNIILEKTSAIPVIDINPRRGSRKPSPKDSLNRWIMKNLRIKYASVYKDRWEIERVNSNLKSMFFFSLEYVYYVPNRHYREAVGIKVLAHVLVTFGNISAGLPKNRKLDTVTLWP